MNWLRSAAASPGLLVWSLAQKQASFPLDSNMPLPCRPFEGVEGFRRPNVTERVKRRRNHDVPVVREKLLQGLDRARGTEGAKGTCRGCADVPGPVLQRRDEVFRRLPIAETAECTGRLSAHLRVGIIQRPEQRRAWLAHADRSLDASRRDGMG